MYPSTEMTTFETDALKETYLNITVYYSRYLVSRYFQEQITQNIKLSFVMLFQILIVISYSIIMQTVSIKDTSCYAFIRRNTVVFFKKA
jgi:hypothetical protein